MLSTARQKVAPGPLAQQPYADLTYFRHARRNTHRMSHDRRSGSILAVFDRPERARVAYRRLSEFVDPSHLEAVPLSPGHYPLADINRALEARSAIRGASAGAALGALVGLLVAALPGPGLFPALGWAAAGALGGVITGGLRSLGRVRWDDEGRTVFEVPENRGYTLLIVKPGVPSDQGCRQRIVRTLVRNGALAFVEPAAAFGHARPEDPLAAL